MRILIVSPQPFYIERGTPIAVDLLCKALTERGCQVDLLAYDVGDEREYPNFTIHRVKSWPRIREVKPGFSLKKIFLDVFLLFKMISMLLRNRYEVIHAVEESAFIAMVLGFLFRVPFVYDMDSNMVTQLINQCPWLKPCKRPLDWVESLPIRAAAAVVPVCDALAEQAGKYRRDNIYTLKDISLVSNSRDLHVEDLRTKYSIGGPLLMYIGNLEKYQGIDLMLDGFVLFARNNSSATLVIIGGEEDDISAYQKFRVESGVSRQIIFAGKRPVSMIDAYMKQADVLISPRTEGVNTPMKIYSYLDSGVAVLATDLPTHNQVMSSNTACLVSPSPEALAAGIEKLISCDDYRCSLATSAKMLIASEHSYNSYCNVLYSIYDDLSVGSAILQ